MSEYAGSGLEQAADEKGEERSLVRGEGILLGLLFTVSVFLLTIGFMLDPDPSGHGTHTQLGLEPCGYLLRTGRPCFLCGATTAFALAAHGRIPTALWTHPLGALLFFLFLLAAFASGRALLTGRSLVLRIALWPWARLLAGLILLGLFSWGFKLLTFRG